MRSNRGIVSFVLVLLALSAQALTVNYVDKDGNTQQVNATPITSSMTSWSGAWYVVNDNVTISTRVTCAGEAKLILVDGKKLTVNGGIKVIGDKSLTIYGQSLGTGALEATAGGLSAGIGGEDKTDGCNISIYGGIVTAKGAGGGAGIGGGKSGSGHGITIGGGTVTAIGSSSGDHGGAGIGGGDSTWSDGNLGGYNIKILGGTVVATGGNGGAGIGGGMSGYGKEIDICGGTVTANGSNKGAGIGGGTGYYKRGCSPGKNITISGGTVTATGSKGGAGIGGGEYSDGSYITISGGRVTAQGGYKGAGIGGGDDKNGTYITISGGTVTAKGNNSAGIGGGEEGSGSDFVFSGGNIYASSVSCRPKNTQGGQDVYEVVCMNVNSDADKLVYVDRLANYGLKDIYPLTDDKALYLWLPNGSYDFIAGQNNYAVKVEGASKTATRTAITNPVTINGTSCFVCSGDGWTFASGVITLTQAKDYKISGEDVYGYARISVKANAKVTLDNLTIRCPDAKDVITFEKEAADATLTLVGNNTVYAKDNHAGVILLRGAKVTLSGLGALVGGRSQGINSRGVFVEGGATLEMNGGTVNGYLMPEKGGGLFSYGTVTMSGGKISGNEVANGEGGGLYSIGTLTMKGGTISGNAAKGSAAGTGNGGGLVVRGGKFSMSGGQISDNTAERYGGGVFLATSSPCTISGGTIEGNKAKNGGGLDCESGTVTLSGGLVKNNNATSDAGGVLVENSSSFEMSGGEITGNKAEGNGGGVYATGGFTMTDGIIRDNTGKNGGALYLITSDKTKSISGGVVLGEQYAAAGTVTFSGGVFDVSPSPIASGYEIVSVGSYYTVAQKGTAAQASNMLTAGRYRFNLMDAKYYSLGIVTPQNFYTALVETDPNVWQLTASKPIGCSEWSEVHGNLRAGNDVVVIDSFTIKDSDPSATVPSGKSLTLDLGDCTITSKLMAKPVFALDNADAALTVGGYGRIVNSATDVASHNGGCFNVTAGSLTLTGGTYAGFRVKTGCNGGCVYVGEDASFAMTDGTISNCWAYGAGGAIASKGTCAVSGGLFTRNSAGNPGGAMAVLGGATVVSGGEFAENGMTAKGGDKAPANGAALAAVDAARLTLADGWFHDNVTAAADEKKGTGAAVYLKLNGAGSATILGGLFDRNQMGGANEIRNVLVATSASGESDVTVVGGFFRDQNPSTLSDWLWKESESVSVRTDWWALAIRGTVQIANGRVSEGTFTFDPMGAPYYVLNADLVPSGMRTICTPATESDFATWQLTSLATETLSYEGQCLHPDGSAVTGTYLVKTYLTTADGARSSETNHVSVAFDANGYYASQTSLDACGFLDRYGEAYLAIDVYTPDGATLVQRENRQKIGFAPYALYASDAESLKCDSLTMETLSVSNSARVGTLTVSAALAVTQSATITNGVVDAEGKVSRLTIDNLTLGGAGTSLLEPTGGMAADLSARKGWTRVASSETGFVWPRDGEVTETVSCAYDGVLFVTCLTIDGGALDLSVTRSDDVTAKETLFARTGLIAADGKGYELSAAVVRGDRVTITAKATGTGAATVAYRYITFGAPREEK